MCFSCSKPLPRSDAFAVGDPPLRPEDDWYCEECWGGLEGGVEAVAGVSCPEEDYTDEESGHKAERQEEFDSPPSVRIDPYREYNLWDFELPGLGESGVYCGTNTVAKARAICPTGDSVRYTPRRCRRLECPDCYQSEDRETAFEATVELEAAARVLEERPHALFFSPPEELWSNIGPPQIKLLVERFYREFRANEQRVRCEAHGHTVGECEECGPVRCSELGTTGHRVGECPECYEHRCEGSEHTIGDCPDCYTKDSLIGGYRVVHHARLLKAVAKLLRREGYGEGGDKGGLWVGVRENALDLEQGWRAYARLSMHVHSIGFPSRIEEFNGTDDGYLLRKYDTLEDVESVLRHLQYLMHHRALGRDGREIRSVKSWGMFHHATDGWDGAEEELGGDRYEELCEEVAGLLGGEWDVVDGFQYEDDESPCCPECGTDKGDFLDLWQLREIESLGGGEWYGSLTEGQQAFYDQLREMVVESEEYAPHIELDRIEGMHPTDVAIWVDGDRPPPDGVDD